MYRYRFLVTSALALGLSACVATAPTPSAGTPATPPVAKAPQCWNGDTGVFQDMGSKATISGVAVTCKATSDGKNAQWMGGGH